MKPEDRIQTLVRRVAGCRYELLTEKEIRGTKNAVMDGIGVLLAGSTLSNKGHILTELALEYGGKEESSVIGYGGKLPAPLAAFANGAMVHCIDYDDYYVYASVHPTHSCLAAALAVSEMRGDVSGKEFIEAFAAAGDLVFRLGLAAAPEGQKENGVFLAYASSFFGAAAVAGKLLKLNEDELISCIGLSFSQLSSSMQILYESEANMREIFPAISAKAGVLAAVLTKRGVRGVKEILDGPAGFFNGILRGVYHPESIDGKENDRNLIADVCIKPSPACGNILIFIDLAVDLVKKYDIDPQQVKKITVKVGKFNYVLCTPEDKRKRPPLPMDAKFSIPYCVAFCIAFGKRPDLAAFFPERLKDQRILELTEKVEVDYVEDLGTGIIVEPGGVSITLKDNTVYSAEGDFPYGSTEKPISSKDLCGKFLECVSYSRKKIEDPEKLMNILMSLETVVNMNDIIAMIS